MFQLGFDFLNEGLSYPMVRIVIEETAEQFDEYFVVREGPVDFYTLAPNLWLDRQYGQGESLLNVFHSLSPKLAQQALNQLVLKIDQNTSFDEWMEILRAATLAEDLPMAVSIWSQIESQHPGKVDLQRLVPLFTAHLQNQVGESLIDYAPDSALQDWTFSPQIIAGVLNDIDGQTLEIRNVSSSYGPENVGMELFLKPETAYAFLVTHANTAQVGILSIEDGEIRDTLILAEVHGEARTSIAFFVTPPSHDPAKPLQVTLFDLLSRGTLQIYDLQLVELTE
jgi:hypothetical protein